jgi:antitoxin (DNA-binding transcriptional repressor) of toxin-antitoxin stability system
MKVAGIRDLKNRLSEYLRLVRSGENILVTDRGEVVAEIIRPRTAVESDLPAGLLKLSQITSLAMGGKNDRSLYPALKRLAPRGTATRLLNEERGDR